MTAHEAAKILTAHGYRARVLESGDLAVMDVAMTEHGAVYELLHLLGPKVSARDLRALLGY